MAAAASGAPAAAPPPPPAPPPPSDEGPPSILSLPAEVAQQVFASLSAADLAACMATCRAWREAAACPPLWQSLAARRWQHGGTVGQLGALRRDGRWLELYRQRRQLDARALSLLSALQWPNRQRATLEQLLQLHYPDVRDVLLGLAGADCIPTAAANKDWPDVAAAAAAAPCLAPYWALQAQEELHVRHCAQRLRRQAAMVEAAAAVLARRAEQAGEPAAGPAGEQPTGAAAPAGQQPPGAAAAAGSAATGGDAAAEAAAMLRQEWDRGESAAAGQSHASAWAGVMHGKADEQLRMLVALAFEEGALALSAVHQHFAELAWVRQALDALGVELRHRMEAEGVRGGLPALRLLSQLLFGPGPPPRHYHFASIPPPDGHGMEITGNRERYYETTNSLLDFVLSNREGIPISLAVLYEAVGVRAGLPITLLNVPMHVVCAMEDPGGGGQEAQRWFVDVFGGGRVLDRFEFSQFLQGLGLPGDQFGLEAQAMTPAQCWMRMCRNLLHLHREHAEYGKLKAVALLMAAAAGEGSAEGMRAAVEAANACMALQQHHEAAELLQTLVGGTYQVQQGHAAALHATALRSMLGEIEAAAEAYVEQQMRVHPREGQEAVSFVVGQVIRHRRYQYRGVIIGWDPECRASEEWVQQMGVDRLPGGRRQPFYHVLPDPEDRPGQAQTYVAQENVQPEALAAPHAADPGFRLHPEVGRYFTALAPGGARYLLSDWMRHCFPGG